MLLAHPGIDQELSTAMGVSYDDLHADRSAAHAEIVRRFAELSRSFDALVVVGSDYTDVSTQSELEFNAQIAANLGAPVVLVVSGLHRGPAEIRAASDRASAELSAGYARPVAVIANRVQPDAVDATRAALSVGSDLPAGVIPEIPLLVAPTVQALQDACGGRLLRGNPDWLRRECLGFVVAAMSLANVLVRLHEDVTVIAPGDRTDLLPGLLLAHQSGTFPHLSAIVLTGGYLPPEPIQRLIAGVQQDLPIIVSDHDTYETASMLSGVRGALSARSPVKVETALRVFAECVDGPGLLAAMEVDDAGVTTPLMFQFRLIERARQSRRRIVLPEGDDERILRASASLLRLGVADLTLLGEETAIRAKASTLGVDIAAAQVLSPTDPESVERFAVEYTRVRAHKGMTVDRARSIVTDVSYFGTMMVHLGLADGMVSGATHTTAHTIRPSFEIIKTVPGTDTVSSVFLMCLADHVSVYGDCAVVPDPTAQQLADIAISSADTAARFGIEPRIALLSYSTGTSGAGEDVDKVRPGHRIGPLPTGGSVGGGADPVRRRGRPGRRQGQTAGVRGGRPGHRADLPGPEHRQQHVQGRATHRRGGGDRPGVAGSEQAGQRPVPRCVGRRHREHRCHHGDPGGREWLMRTVLVVNSGSSSMKFQLVDLQTEQALASGLAERVGEPAGHVQLRRGSETEQWDGEIRRPCQGSRADQGTAVRGSA